MRLSVGVPTSSAPDRRWGELGADFVIDPVRQRVTHLIVQPHGRHDRARLIPVDAIAACDERVTLSMSMSMSPKAIDSLAGATTTYDPILTHTAVIRRTSQVVSNDSHTVGGVDGPVIDIDHGITYLVLDHGRLVGRHQRVTIPIGEVASVEPEAVHLCVPRDDVGCFPSAPLVRHHHGS